MTGPFWDQVPVAVTEDLEHGGRCTSLRAGDREWLWVNPDAGVQAERRSARPGDAFPDAGGAEECIPTVRGRPDHGDAWARRWRPGPTPGQASVDFALHPAAPASATLHRVVRQVDHAVQLDYTVTGPPGGTFLHAVHALLELGPAARLTAHGAAWATVLDQPTVGQTRVVPWPSGLDRLGPDDGSATCAVLTGCRAVDVEDDHDRLCLAWSCDDLSSCSLLLWRNLGGWPSTGGYRSIGIEPMVGAAADRGTAAAGALARLGADGTFTWSLTCTAYRRR